MSKENDIRLIEEEFEVLDDEEGLGIDDDGYDFEFYSICVNNINIFDGKVFDELIKKLDRLIDKLDYYEGYDFNLDRGMYFGSLANLDKGEMEIRFTKMV